MPVNECHIAISSFSWYNIEKCFEAINNKDYTNSLKRALEAVNVYINTEKDLKEWSFNSSFLWVLEKCG